MKSVCLCACAVLACESFAGPTFSFPEPDLDRWEYPFNTTTRGFRDQISTFSSLGQESIPPFTFDQRDGQFLIRFDADSQIESGLTPCGYFIESAVIRAQISNNNQFEYDETYDDFTSYLPDGDPNQTADTDLGRPLELYGVGYRGGFTAGTFVEGTVLEAGTPFGSAIQSDSRFAYASDLRNGSDDDVSNNVRDGFDPLAFAIGTTGTVMPGQLVPFDTDFEFELDASNVDVQAYLREALDSGDLMVVITALAPASSDGGPGSGSFASFYAKENFFGAPASLEITLGEASPGDVNLSGSVTFDDLISILFQFGRTNGLADVDCSGLVDFSDLIATLFLFD